MKKGDLSARTPTGDIDEIGDLTDALNSMADQLDGLIHGLEEKVLERAAEPQGSELRFRSRLENNGTATGTFGDLIGYSRMEIQGGTKSSDLVLQDDLHRMRHYHA